MLKLILDLISDKPIDPNNYQQVLETVAIATNKIRLHQFDNEPLVTTINNFCNKTPSKTFIVSLSGGVDSMVVISIIHYLGYNVIAAHINYNNRPETILEEQFLDEWCKFNEIKLYKKVITNIKRATTKRSDYETITKMIRIEFYKEILKKENSDVIILGHHKDDIIENIFANVCRGRNLLDLAVIQEHTVLSNINIARPMLDYYKQTILDFAKKYQIPYFKDTTPDWSVRGKYRNQIYPLIEDTFTKTIKTNLIYLSEQSSQWNQLINNEIIKPFMQTVTINNKKKTVEFNVEKYKSYPLCFWNYVFMDLFNQFNLSYPSRKGVQTFINNIQHKTVCYASISNNCKCYIKNYNVLITFI
jgi:tRNA(Ile)-lysidine synthetase-like protein